ncbi:MAG: ABC transporter permease [Acidobacteria bacterium]|nr:ABC transporter permease [Acidobacteriota bacterium]
MTTPSSTIRTAFEAIGRNLLRSALTSLGIIIGVAAVIVMMAIGGGARASIEASVSSLGTNIVTVSAGSMSFGGVRMGQGAVTTLVPDDARAIREGVSGVSAVSPGVSTRTQVLSSTGNWQTQVQGVGSELPVMRAWPVDLGVFFDDEAVTRSEKVAVLGAVVRDQLFGAGVDPLGQTIRVNNQPFTVIAVLSRKGQSPMGQDMDDTVMVPYTTAQKRLLGITHIANVTVGLDGSRSAAAVSDDISSLLRVRHRLQPGAEDDFSIRSAEEMATVLTSTTSTMTALLASVAAISLIVGGIGIMNIMLVSVTERTREIGLRRAIGARRTDVLAQFLIEAMALSLLGGLTGVLVGIGTARGLTALLQWTTVVSPSSVAVSFGFAALVGVIFGYVPARRAAGLNPREALHFE